VRKWMEKFVVMGYCVMSCEKLLWIIVWGEIRIGYGLLCGE
jgi:hypothetical protein